SAAQNARHALPGLVCAYFEAGRELMEGALRPAALHRFRLDTKALRYTLELFRPCYGPGLERLLSELRRIQGCLGLISDYATCTELVASHLAGTAPERVRIEALLNARTRRKSLELRRYWKRIADAPGAERRWRSYLARPRK
ncbi:MAG TPA: CHAD domain-containing protein, partial [Bryobacteraceae bacterium]|nr:CHAD domain-containing protein [Bryobacteraceae bacterium]